jgi:two-component system chemotaxis response regulator CheY
MKILVADDSKFMRNMVKGTIKNYFSREELIFIEASNGQEAIEKYKEELPCLVMMDITMDIMNGIEATRRIKEFDINCRIIMISALGQNYMIKDALDAGASDFIIKPFLEEKVIEAIINIMKE